MLSPRRYGESREQKMMRAAHLVAGETLRLLHEASFHDDVDLRHARHDLRVDVRLPDEERVAWARDILKRIDAGEECAMWDKTFAYGVTLLYDGFAEDPVDHLPIHALRVGDLAIATQPCELFCRFGLDIKRRSPAPQTAVFGIVNRAVGYCPTAAGILGGGYSGEPIDWTRYAVDTGDRIVDCASRLLREMWK
jgi:hypothetical protein